MLKSTTSCLNCSNLSGRVERPSKRIPNTGPSFTPKEDDDHVEKVGALIGENLSLLARECDEEVGLSRSSGHATLTGKLYIHLVAANFVPNFFTDEQKGETELLDLSDVSLLGVVSSFTCQSASC